jgi:nucleoside-diphosphate-sugar epimerase
MPAISATDGPVAVTGVSGYTGGHMVRELVHHGYTVRACLRDGASWRGQDAIGYLSQLPNVEIVEDCDLFVPGSYDAAFKGCVGVFHVAAVLGNSVNDQPNGEGDGGKDTYNGGIVGTQNVIDAINKSGTVKRLIYTSSMAAVSNATKGGDHEWTETDWASDGHDTSSKPWQTNWYGRSKVDTEHLVNEAATASGGAKNPWDVITMNPAMITGPILFAAQNGQWIEQIGRLAGGLEPNCASSCSCHIILCASSCSCHIILYTSTLDIQLKNNPPTFLQGPHGTTCFTT